ncbi:hypothetical protein FIBSPDRAFT_1036978 [Athelia psychrophila]|uniref:G domain-containing protein n=1 Tax=Athelia psychrophila TaxID=1759441 RepID=A0A166V4T7_9AGAM|nr:hypothetical protein FIBSPDRAFT_1036978 [Fibularhizoctonia sp. CBS 109695]
MSLFKILRRRASTTSFEDIQASTPSFEGVQAPFAQLGQASQSAPALDEDGRDIRERFNRIRILVIGRANAGKTTVLQKVCGTTDQPVVYNARGNKIKKPNFLMPSRDRGLHDINNATVFESNPGFIFHDSRGFEAGGAQELEDVKAFISTRSDSIELEDQIHAIWYCIPLDDDRPFTRAEISFFSECGTGSVPVIVIFTKFDAMDDKAFSELKRSGLSTDEARVQAPGHAGMMFERDLRGMLYGMKYPPKNHVLLRVFTITLDLSFFIWHENPSKECLSQALSVYKEATTNHEAVMKAVTEAFRLKQGDSILTREKAFRVRMTEIVLAHRLSGSYRAGTGRG